MNNHIIANAIGIKKCENNNEKTVYHIEENGVESTIVFDNIYAKWMQRLYELVVHIGQERDARKITLDMMREYPIFKFFGLAESVSNQLMYEFVKDELSQSTNNCNLDRLAYHILPQPEYEPFYGGHIIDELAFTQIKRYLNTLVCVEFNKFTMAQFYDYYISFWSCFEDNINGICEKYLADIKDLKRESDFKRITKYIRQSFGEDFERQFKDRKDEYIESFPSYISFPDNYNYLFKHVINNTYSRNINSDKEKLLYFGAFRNTLHNNGIHKNKDTQIDIAGETFNLIQNKPAYFDDHSKVFLLTKEIFDIYVAIVDAFCKIENDSNGK